MIGIWFLIEFEVVGVIVEWIEYVDVFDWFVGIEL